MLKHRLINVTLFVLNTFGSIVPVDGFHLDQVDNPFEVVFSAYRHLNRYRVTTQSLFNLLDNTIIIGPGTVHLVNKDQPWHVVLIGLSPDRFRLRLYTTNRTKYCNCAIQNPQRTFDLNGEINVPRCINDIDTVFINAAIHALPETSGGSRRNGYAAFLLLFHPVHRGSAIVDFTYFVRNPGIKQNPFCCCGFAGIDMGHDTQIAVSLYWSRSCHFSMPYVSFVSTPEPAKATSGSEQTPC